jgi:hypothetical protein
MRDTTSSCSGVTRRAYAGGVFGQYAHHRLASARHHGRGNAPTLPVGAPSPFLPSATSLFRFGYSLRWRTPRPLFRLQFRPPFPLRVSDALPRVGGHRAAATNLRRFRLLAGSSATRRGPKPTPPPAQFRKVLEDSPRFFAKLHKALLSTEDCPPTDVIQRSSGHRWKILHRKWLTH